MIRPYEIFMRSEVVDSLRHIRGNSRRHIAAFIDSLALNPFSEGDFTINDASDRKIHIKVLGQYAVIFWSDHPAKEIKIIDIRSADRA
jgi:mRNA-degrading endonuclease RelE of RelBE toxin-antitoxin system